MILAEKFSQKLNNLKSKNELKDFFVFYNESRILELSCNDGAVSKDTEPTHYSEYSEGKFLIVWNDDAVSKGLITNTSVNNFEEFIIHARKTSIQIAQDIFIPERGIYPMVRTYSKALADMIELPEYLLKISDITDELDRMVGAAGGSCRILVREGTKYAHSSRALDEYFPYTEFDFEKTFPHAFSWQEETTDVFSVAKFQEILSFLGDLYNHLKKSPKIDLDKDSYDIVLAPSIFRQIFEEQILASLSGDNILKKKSLFSAQDFKSKLKVLGTMSISYDPLANIKRGTYRFTEFGLKPAKQYFVKFGKLDLPIMDAVNFSTLGYESPSMEILHFNNLKIEGLKKKVFNDIFKLRTKTLFVLNTIKTLQKKNDLHAVYSSPAILFDSNKTYQTTDFAFEINLYKSISEGNVELIEFIDGQFGVKINNIKLKK